MSLLPPRPPERSSPVDSDLGAVGAQADLEGILVAGEIIVAVALQHRLFALTHRRRLVAATTGRFILMNRRLLGGYDLIGVRWQDIRQADIAVGPITAALSVAYSADLSDTAGGEDDTRLVRVAGLRREEAQALYRECQSQEQSWREKRRVRMIEEMRARAGGVQIATGVYPSAEPAPRARPVIKAPSGTPALSEAGPAERLARAKAMLDQGLISDTEFWAVKAKIVDSL